MTGRRSRISLIDKIDQEVPILILSEDKKLTMCKQVYQIVRKLIDELEKPEAHNKPVTVTYVYNSIKQSNSSLKRRNKRSLEESIERALQVLKQDMQEESDNSVQNEKSIKDFQENNIVNRSITKMWTNPPRITPSITPKDSNRKVKNLENNSHSLSLETEGESMSKSERQANGEPKLKRRKAESSRQIDRSPPRDISLECLGGVDDVIQELNELVALPMLYPESYLEIGIEPPRGVLLHGPPGCGKTMIANAYAAEIGVSYIPLSAPSLVAGMSGESEKKIREIFEEAVKIAPCIVFIDEVEVIMGKRESAQREMEKRIVAQMLTCMDEISLKKTNGKPVMIIAATNRPDCLDPALRRAGRFNKEINLGVPNELARVKILKALTRNLKLADGFDFESLAKQTPGFVGADLNDVVSVAGTEAIKREFKKADDEMIEVMKLDPYPLPNFPPTGPIEILRSLIQDVNNPPLFDDFSITYQDFISAIAKVQPSAKREGFSTIPDTTWSHIGALHSIREQLQMTIVEPIKNPEAFARVGITTPAGVLLWGPPGCGKTLLAKAVANESKANFISIKGPELLNKYVGESERAVRQVFDRARSSVPCILFFDELDALVPKREDSLSEASCKVVNTLLTELDGLSNRAGIYVIAATNRPDMIDPAMLRPGRLGTSVFVDLPTETERVEILKALYKNALPLASEEEVLVLENVAQDARCKGFSGADLSSLHQAAAIAALKRTMVVVDGISTYDGNLIIKQSDWEVALETMRASVKDAKKYQKLKERGL
ncbi:putative AAA domain-containing protein C16E9.10c [Erysiphe neolycopersici]|uniref:Peroxisomal ATPase PEX1 n=1 Tax=Erysiphe neolycopersici TaxID=212602 RepID=A0A420I1G3_9PEZI|nr:putative AAA domain-containing protein C16E9.10c [Erysiphe neolycopersici]